MLTFFGLEMEDICNPRNLLRLHQSIERAFDRRELAFIVESNDLLVGKVLSPEMVSEQLKWVQRRFANIHGEKLEILNQGLLCFRHLLVHRSVPAHQCTHAKGWIGDDPSAEEFKAGALLEH